jgi:hypothetical protein
MSAGGAVMSAGVWIAAWYSASIVGSDVGLGSIRFLEHDELAPLLST